MHKNDKETRYHEMDIFECLSEIERAEANIEEEHI